MSDQLSLDHLSVCFIGAGPCTLAALHHLRKQYPNVFPYQVTVFEKQSSAGGMWQANGNWRVGTDEFGLPTHHSMYKDLWSNGPKECLEIPTWTFEDCFGVNLPSFPPRAILAEYILKRAENDKINHLIQFNTSVVFVTYDGASKKFTVQVEHLREKKFSEHTFDYVVVANGHFSVPNIPSFAGIESFPGRVLHSHDYRSGYEFKGHDILVVGSSYSAEDIALQTLKFGAKTVTVSYRSGKMDFGGWPKGFQEQRPLIQHVSGSTVTFIDGSSGEFDDIILCTGYLHRFPFLAPNLRLQTHNQLYPPLYKGIVYPDNHQILYLGMQDLYYTFTMFDLQALWALQYIEGKQARVVKEEMLREIAEWQARQNSPLIEGAPYWKKDIDFQSDYVNELTSLTSYPYNVDCREILFAWEVDKHENVTTYRDKAFTSLFTKKTSPVHHTVWWNAFDDSKDTFMNQTPSVAADPLYRGTTVRPKSADAQ